MQRNIPQSLSESSDNSLVIRDDQNSRLDAKLRRELGDTVLSLLADDLTEDIVLNPDFSLWAKRMGAGFQRVGEMSSTPRAP